MAASDRSDCGELQRTTAKRNDSRDVTTAKTAAARRRRQRQRQQIRQRRDANPDSRSGLGLSKGKYIVVLVGSIEPTNVIDRTRAKSLVRLTGLNRALAQIARRLGSGERPGSASLKRAAWVLIEALGPRLASPERLGERPCAYLKR
ncbi:hypothetical protein B296_00038816 [Ensete ventricosum]|uniref:Uncharacterized protein n=1 Tax=Ensete ventricosum TaxID=4639 RepID=A0A426ZAC9_ENSVE|nr:hypothetical protein B296_00038816 [Ensete ventricosum]